MRAQNRLASEDSGALHLTEAVMSAILIVSTMAGVLSIQHYDTPAEAQDLHMISSDLLYLLEYRENLPGHPRLAETIASPGDWDARADSLEKDVRSMLPEGIGFFLTTPYGTVGDLPPARASKHVRTFEAYRTDEKKIIQCQLVLWRG